MRRITLMLAFIWRRTGDASTLSWLAPNSWATAVSALLAIATAVLNAVARVPYFLWIPFALLVFAFALIVTERVAAFLRLRQQRPRLEIHFDPANPLKRFWSFEPPRDKDGKSLPGIQHEYQVAIFNPTVRNVRNISISVESLGSAGHRPIKAVFDRTRTETCDLNPGCSEFAVVLHWPHPKVQPGMLAGPSALAYGPLLVTVSADDVPPATRQFWLDYQREPMLFDRLEPDEPEPVS